MRAILFSEFLKQAGYETYDYKGSSSRNYIPPRSNIKPLLGDGSGSDDSKVVKMKPRNNPDMPKNGANRPIYAYETPVGIDHQHARATVSGTGFGRRYWAELKNGYGI